MNFEPDTASGHDCGVDTAAYVLGALDPHEVKPFERHLRSCSICEAEVESLRLTLSILPMSSPQFPASKELRRRVMRSVRADAELAPNPGRRATDRRQTLSFGRGRVPRYAPPRGFRPGLVSGVAALVLVVVVVMAGVLAAGTGRHRGQVIDASVGSAQLMVQNGHGELIVHHLAQLPSAYRYEVWLERGGSAPQPTTTLFNTAANGKADVTVSGSLNGASKLLVTREPAAGAVVPSHHLVVVVPDLS